MHTTEYEVSSWRGNCIQLHHWYCKNSHFSAVLHTSTLWWILRLFAYIIATTGHANYFIHVRTFGTCQNRNSRVWARLLVGSSICLFGPSFFTNCYKRKTLLGIWKEKVMNFEKNENLRDIHTPTQYNTYIQGVEKVWNYHFNFWVYRENELRFSKLLYYGTTV